MNFKHKHKWRPLDSKYVAGKGIYVIEACTKCYRYAYQLILSKERLLEEEKSES